MAAGVVFCACASTASVTETSARALWVSSISLRRSNASASMPPPAADGAAPVTSRLDPGAGALHRSALDAAFVRGQLRLHPFRPTDVQLLAEEPELCQLQSGLGPDVSVLVPAVHDERLVARELARHLLQLVERDADRALDVGLGERVAGARIEQHDLVRSRLLLHPVDHALLLGFRAQLGREELPVGTDVVR